jgi:signal transduction histidine kinase
MANLSAARLLIVDDEELQVKALCETLREHGFTTTGFSDPMAALEALRGASFDLLLCDLMMPCMNGIELLNAALRVDSNLVGIIMTGQGTISTAVESMKAGALDYVLKPFTLSIALPVLARALSIRRLRLDNAALQRDLKERNAVLEVTNRELDGFASAVAHDLHAPVRHIRAYAQLLGEESAASLSESSRKHLAHIVDSARHLGKLIDDLLKFSRTAHQELRTEVVDLNRIVSTVRASLEPESQGRDIHWTIADLPIVRGDPSLLYQVYYNLLSNAVKYTQPRTLAEIELGRLANAAEHWVLFVKDNGVGFDNACAEKLFGVFQRLHPTQFTGSGIGLANVRRIISRHAGRTWAEGEVDKGACFYFTLPRETKSGSNP